MSLWIPKKDENGKRRYGAWAGQPSGWPEDKERCIFEVSCTPPSPLFRQCARKRGHGPGGEFCKQHAKKAEQG